MPKYGLRILCLALVVATTSGFGVAQAFQVSNNGGTVKFMQTGNRGVSANFTVASTMRIEGRGVVVENNAGALRDVPLPVPPAPTGSSSAVINQVLAVCTTQDPNIFNVMPRGSDTAMTTYTQCVDQGQNSYECAVDWVRMKGYLLADECGAASEIADAPEAPADEIEEELFRPAPPIEPEEPAVESAPLNLVFEPTDEAVDEPLLPDPAVVERPTSFTSTTPVTAWTPRLKTEFALLGDHQGAGVAFPRSFDQDFHAAADRPALACDGRLRIVLLHYDWWQWLAMRLFVILVCLVVAIFVLALWVFVLWRRYEAMQESKKLNSKKITKL